LSNLVLDLAAWGVRDPAAFAWLDPPPKPAWAEAQALLTRIGALSDGGLTEYGARLARMPLPPRLAHMVLAAGEDTLLAARIAVVLTEQGLGGRGVDLRDRLHRFGAERGQRAEAARRLADRIARQAGGGDVVDEASAGIVLARAFPDRVAKRRGEAFLMANGRAASVDAAEPISQSPYLVIADIAGAAGRAQVLLAAPIDAAEIEAMFAKQIETHAAVTIDAATGALRGRRTRRLGRIVLSEAPLDKLSADDLRDALMEAVREDGLSLLDWSEAAKQVRARVDLMRSLEGEAWPDWSDAALIASFADWLEPALDGVKRLKDVDVARALLNALPYALRRKLDTDAPTHFETPAGSALRIDYEAEGGPALDVRLQELFGMDKHPSVGGGRVPLTLRLLSPAHRPVQTTKDLPGFWRGSYAAVRSDMRGRYPKHPWPEDPLSAPPTRRAKPKGA
jgi:ATP-dependent helicase HrpB